MGWVAAALGMGIVFPTIPLAAMEAAEAGRESSDLSPTLLMDMTGVAVGQGFGGIALANAVAIGLGVAVGLGGAFATTGVAAVLLLLVAPRIPGPRGAGRSGDVRGNSLPGVTIRTVGRTKMGYGSLLACAGGTAPSSGWSPPWSPSAWRSWSPVSSTRRAPRRSRWARPRSTRPPSGSRHGRSDRSGPPTKPYCWAG